MEKCHLQSVVKWSKELRCFNFISSINRKHIDWKSIKKILIYQILWADKTLGMNQARFARKNETYWVVFIYIHVVWGNGILKLGLLIHDFFIGLKHDFKNVRDLKRKTNNPTHVLHFSYYKKHLWPLWFEFQFRRHKCFCKLNWHRGSDKDRRPKMWQVQLHNESPPLW